MQHNLFCDVFISHLFTQLSNSTWGVTTANTNAEGRYVLENILHGTLYEITPYLNAYKCYQGQSRGWGEAERLYSYEVICTVLDTDKDGISDAQERIDGTNPNDRGSVLTRLSTTVCSEWNGYLGGMWNIMEHINLSSNPLNVHSVLYSIDGVLRGSEDFRIPPFSQFDLIVHDMEGWQRDSYGKVCSTIEGGAEGDLDGRMVYYKPVDSIGSTYEFAFAMPFLNGSKGTQFVTFNTYQPSFDISDSNNIVANWIQLTNLENYPQTGKMFFHAQDSALLAEPLSVSLAAGARQDFSAHQFGKNLVGIVKWQADNSEAKFQMRNVRYIYDNPRADNSFDSAFQLEAASGSGELLSAPLDTKDASAIVEIANTRSHEQYVAARFYNKDGVMLIEKAYNLAPYASVHVIADDILNGKSGSVQVQGSAAEGVLAIVMQYGRTQTGAMRYIYGTLAQQALGLSLRSSYNTFLNQSCNLLLVNSEGVSNQASISMLRFDGKQVLYDLSISIPAHGLVDYNLCDNDSHNVYGTVTINASKNNSIFTSIVRLGQNDEYRFPTLVRQ